MLSLTAFIIASNIQSLSARHYRRRVITIRRDEEGRIVEVVEERT